jgi:glycosyltransferase involved in cell wall biosynthesis
MRLLYVIPRYGAQFTSNETHGEIVRELQRLGLHVDVLSFTTRSGAGGPGGWSGGFGSEQVYRHVQGAHPFERPLALLARHALHYEYLFSMLAGYLHVTRQRRYDLIHAEGTFPLGAVAALAAPLLPTPYVITTTGGDLFRLPGQGYGYGHWLLPRMLMRLALQRAAWIRTNSRLIGRLAASYGADTHCMTPLAVSIADICMPPAGIALQDYRAACRAALAAHHGWPQHVPVLVCVGRLISLKAPELLIEALPALQETVGPVQVCIVGPSRPDAQRGDYLEFLRQRAAALGVADRCTFTGAVPLPDIKTYLAASSLLVVPSRIEGLNRVVIEAGAVGTPSVISDGAGAAELVACYGCGLITPVGSVSALQHAITRLLASPLALAECGERALTLARDHTAAAVARGLVDIYAQAQNASVPDSGRR